MTATFKFTNSVVATLIEGAKAGSGLTNAADAFALRVADHYAAIGGKADTLPTPTRGKVQSPLWVKYRNTYLQAYMGDEMFAAWEKETDAKARDRMAHAANQSLRRFLEGVAAMAKSGVKVGKGETGEALVQKIKGATKTRGTRATRPAADVVSDYIAKAFAAIQRDATAEAPTMESHGELLAALTRANDMLPAKARAKLALK